MALVFVMVEVDVVLLADGLEGFGGELVEDFLEDLYLAEEFALVVLALDLAEDVVLVAGFGVVEGLLAGDDVLFN